MNKKELIEQIKIFDEIASGNTAFTHPSILQEAENYKHYNLALLHKLLQNER